MKLWQILYDRPTNVDEIHNLICVYTGDCDTFRSYAVSRCVKEGPKKNTSDDD